MKILIFFLSLLLVILTDRERQKTTQAPQVQPKQTRLQRFRTTKTYRWLVRAGELILILVTLGQGIVAFWGPFWPTDPEIQAHDTVDASSFVLPFRVTNRSILFDMPNMEVNCGVDLVYFMTGDGFTGVLRDAQFNPGPISVGRNSINNYPCSAKSYINGKLDGSLTIGFPNGAGQSMSTPPGPFHEPLTIIKMCIWISGSYKVWGFYPVKFKSKMFQWPAVPGQRQWIEGAVTPDLPNEAWIPNGSRVGAVWALRPMMTSDKKNYLPGALQCTRIE
jgi:hypothetical protein